MRWAGPPRGALPDQSASEGRFSVSTEQRENLDAILRRSALPFDSDVSELRRLTREYALPILDEAAAALDRAGQLLTAHLASAERVTA